MSFLDDVLGAAVASVLSVTVSLVGSIGTPDPSPGTPSTSAPAPAPDPAPDSPTDELVAGGGWVGHDVSWPNCPKGQGIAARRTLGLPLPPPWSRFVVIGLTNGPAFYPNPCLSDQVAYAHAQRLWTAAYAVVTYPTSQQLRVYGGAGPRPGRELADRLWNTGWVQARVNIASMRVARLASPVLWLDVEPVRPPAPWSADVVANRMVVEGSMAAYRRAGLRLGVYSTPYLWRSVVGSASYGLPEWRAAGPTSRQAALALCTGDAIQGGEAVLAQWVAGIDTDVLCPRRRGADVLREFFSPR